MVNRVPLGPQGRVVTPTFFKVYAANIFNVSRDGSFPKGGKHSKYGNSERQSIFNLIRDIIQLGYSLVPL